MSGGEKTPAGINSGVRQTYTVEQTAQILGIGRNAAYGAVKRGEIPHIQIGRKFLVPAAALDRLLDVDAGTVGDHQKSRRVFDPPRPEDV